MTSSSAEEVINQVNKAYLGVHEQFEDAFWAFRMNLQGASGKKYEDSKSALDTFLMDVRHLKQVETCLEESPLTTEEEQVLKIMQRTFRCYILQNDEAVNV